MQRVTGRLVLVALGIAVLVPVGGAPAFAVPTGNAQVRVLAAAGSDTTQDVMSAVLAAYNGDGTANPVGDVAVNIPVRPVPPITVAGDDTCEQRSYVPAGQESPPVS